MKKITEFENIKAMDIEKMSEFLCDNFDCDVCPAYDANYCTVKSGTICNQAMKKYLENEVINKNENSF